MAFRADEARENGKVQAQRYLIRSSLAEGQREESRAALLDIIEELGPVIDAYPTWHPLVAGYPENRRYGTTPNAECGFPGVDHTVHFAHGFLTCPYPEGGSELLSAVEKLKFNEDHPLANITAERLDMRFYHPRATPILVRCEWKKELPAEKLVPKSRAVPLLLERELPCWRWSEVGETWETMSPEFLGRPHGRLSSLFVSRETGQSMKKVWEAITESGMFGPIMVDDEG